MSTGVIIVAIFSGRGVVGLLGTLVQSAEERQLRQLLLSGYLMLPQRGTKEDYERFVASTLTSKSASELKKLRALIAALPDSTDATEDQHRDLHQAAIDAVSNLRDVQRNRLRSRLRRHRPSVRGNQTIYLTMRRLTPSRSALSRERMNP